MRLRFLVSAIGATLVMAAGIMCAQDLAVETWQQETRGEASQARERLRRAADIPSASSVATVRAFAEFLDRHREPGARDAYARLLEMLSTAGAPSAERASVARRLVAMDLALGDRTAAQRHLRGIHCRGRKWPGPSGAGSGDNSNLH